MLNSLDRHLSHPDQHEGLPFHPDCPVCRARVTGNLPAHGVLSRQTHAALAAGVLAISAVGPTAAVAAPPRAPAAPVDPTLDPDWEAPGPEGESGTESPQEAPPVVDDGGGGGEDETGPVESEPLTEATPEVESDEPPPGPAPPAAERAAPTRANEPPAPAAGEPAAPDQAVEAPTAGEPAAEAAPEPKQEKPGNVRGRTRDRAHQLAQKAVPASPPVAAPAPAAELESAADLPISAPVTTSVAAPAGSATAIKGERYKVRPGDSLWLIAERLLGPGASSGELAREVHRLWSLNDDRIATGDPDLLPVGTVLKLR